MLAGEGGPEDGGHRVSRPERYGQKPPRFGRSPRPQRRRHHRRRPAHQRQQNNRRPLRQKGAKQDPRRQACHLHGARPRRRSPPGHSRHHTRATAHPRHLAQHGQQNRRRPRTTASRQSHQDRRHRQPPGNRQARESRAKEGKHIIPVPTIELKPHFSGYLIDPLEIFFKKPQAAAKRRKLGEKSIVRPTFSYYGKLFISDAVIASIVDHVATSDIAVTRTGQINIKNSHDREKGISISLDVTIKYGQPLRQVLIKSQQRIKDMVEYMTGMMVKDVNIEVRRLSID